MPRFSANLSMLFSEHDFLDRFDAAARAGFTGVEYVGPYDHAPEMVAARLEEEQARRRCCSTCRRAIGPRASAASLCCQTASTSSARGVDTAITYAKALGCGADQLSCRHRAGG